MTLEADRRALLGMFTHVVFKELMAVEVDSGRSNQHEFNVPKALLEALGRDQPQHIAARFVWLPDKGTPVSVRGDLTLYDARARHPTRSEFRLYYRSNDVTRRASPGDLLLMGIRPDRSVVVMIAPGGGSSAAKIQWLFSIEVCPGAAFSMIGLQRFGSSDVAAALGAGFISADDYVGDGWDVETVTGVIYSNTEVLSATALAQANLLSCGQAPDDLEW